MSWFHELTSRVGPAALGSELVDLVAKATLLLLVAWGIAFLLRGASASVRHQLWTAALIAVLALPLLSRVLPAWRVSILPAAVGSSADGTSSHGVSSEGAASEGAASEGRISSTPVPSPSVVGELVDRASASAAVRAPGEAEVVAEVVAGKVAAPDLRAPDLRAPALRVPGLEGRGDAGGADLAKWALLLWAAGSLLFLARLLVSSIAAWKTVRDSAPVTDTELRAEVSALCRQLGLRSEVNLVEHSRITMPMAWGVFRQTVLLPASAGSWTAARRRVVLLHELAHLKRWDCQTLLLARVVSALHWFNPLVWVAVRRLQAEREHACDDLVLTAGTPGADYAQHLLDIARAVRSSLSPGWAMVAMARPSELEGRLLAILDPNLDRGQTTRTARFSGVLAIVLLVLPLASLQPRASAESVASHDVLAEDVASQNAPSRGKRAESSRNARLVEVFSVALRDEDAEVRAQAARSLGSIEHAAAVPILTKTVRDDASAGAREQAAWALGMIESDAAVPALKAALADDSDGVREQAAWALGMIENETAVAELRVALADRAATVREQAAWALGMIESDAAAEGLGKALGNDDEAGVREQAAWALGMIESPSAVGSLMSALEADTSDAVREQAAWALGMIEDEEALDALLDAMSDDSTAVRKQALWAVGRISG